MTTELIPALTPTSDLSDAFPEAVVLPPVFHDYGGQVRFSGTVQTLKVHENNPLVRQMLETSGAGRVLVVDGGGSRNCALLGGQLGQLAVDHGWAGVVIHGCVRDTAELRALPVGIRAPWAPTPAEVARRPWERSGCHLNSRAPRCIRA